jgi:hypothetical protein
MATTRQTPASSDPPNKRLHLTPLRCAAQVKREPLKKGNGGQACNIGIIVIKTVYGT